MEISQHNMGPLTMQRIFRVNERADECTTPLLLTSQHTFRISQSAANLLTCLTLWRPPAGTQKHKHMFIFSNRMRHFIQSVKSAALVVNFLLPFRVFSLPDLVSFFLSQVQPAVCCMFIITLMTDESQHLGLERVKKFHRCQCMTSSTKWVNADIMAVKHNQLIMFQSKHKTKVKTNFFSLQKWQRYVT